MEKTIFINKLQQAFADNGYADLLDAQSAEALWRLAVLLIETNKITNLTAITDENGIILKHFLDSATVAPLIPSGSTVIDIGCGAGFPSLPLAIIREDLQITSLDSTGKKIDFVKATAAELSLTNINPICGRAEEFISTCRESFDACVSRAVARLNVLSELCLPFVKPSGRFLPMKAANKGTEELAEAKIGISRLGGELLSTNKLHLSFEEEVIERALYVIKKKTATPMQYPRQYAKIIKKPL